MRQRGADGWELVAVLPFTYGNPGAFSGPDATVAALAFFKRLIPH
jgi:hypothetical protein